MTIEHAPSMNGRGASDEAHDAAPRADVSGRAVGRRPRQPGLLRLLMPVLLAVAMALVLRGIAEAPEEEA